MSEFKFRPDNGLRIAVFAHILEYYGNLGIKSAIKDIKGINELGVLAKSIADKWTEEVEEFDGNVKDMKETYQELIGLSDSQEKEIAELVAKLEESKKPAKKASAKTPKKVADEQKANK